MRLRNRTYRGVCKVIGKMDTDIISIVVKLAATIFELEIYNSIVVYFFGRKMFKNYLLLFAVVTTLVFVFFLLNGQHIREFVHAPIKLFFLS